MSARLTDLFWDTLRKRREANANPSLCPAVPWLRERIWTSAEFERLGLPGSSVKLDPYALATTCTYGIRLPIPGSPDAPEMRTRVVEAALAVADMAQHLLLETFLRSCDRADPTAGVPLRDRPWRMPYPARWARDTRPLFAEGRLQRPQGNLLGGSGLTLPGSDFLADVRRVRQLLPGALLLVVPPRVAQGVSRALSQDWRLREERRAHENAASLLEKPSAPLPADFCWAPTSFEANAVAPVEQDWFAVQVGSVDPNSPKPLTVHVEEPRCWVQDQTNSDEAREDPTKSAVMIATRACVEVTNPELCVKVEYRG